MNANTTAPLAAITGPSTCGRKGQRHRRRSGQYEEVAAVLRFAQENRFTVVPYGGGTKQGWGYPVSRRWCWRCIA
jgi:FAD/FMN-containing dehydrogenase